MTSVSTGSTTDVASIYGFSGEQQDDSTGVDEAGTDFGALMAGYVSITPLQLDLTAREALEGLQGWVWK